MNDISTRADVEQLVDAFYAEVMKDEVLAPFFARLDFNAHLPKMVHFWTFVLLDEPGYTTNVTEKHMKMPLQEVHFKHWLSLFHKTVDTYFAGEKAELAKQRASLVGWTIQQKVVR